MSNAIFPSLIGQSIEVSRIPSFSTRVQTSVSGGEARAAMAAYPKWKLTAQYDVLQAGRAGSDFETLEAFFLQMRGAWSSFLVSAPSDNRVSDMPFGAGTGLQKTFQLTRTRSAGGFGFTEPVQNLAATPVIKVGGVTMTTSDFSLNDTGQITFVTAPALSAALVWSGEFYYRCRFADDEIDLERFLEDLWSLGKIEMTGSPVNKV